MASIGRRGWRQAKTSLTKKFDGRVTLPLADVLERVTRLQDQVAELTDVVKGQVEMGNQTTELLGRLLAASSSRLEEVEDSLHQLSTPGSSQSSKKHPRGQVTGASSASGNPSQH